jgi:hypothetical protein
MNDGLVGFYFQLLGQFTSLIKAGWIGQLYLRSVNKN